MTGTLKIEGKIEQLNSEVSRLQRQIAQWGFVLEAISEKEDPHRDRMVIKLLNKYVATYRWEINPNNGWLTVQLQDGSIVPTRISGWCPYSSAVDFFTIDRNDIIVDDPQKG